MGGRLRPESAIGSYEIISAYKPVEVKSNNVMYATIDIFKGLEADVVILADTHIIPEDEKQKLMYVEASRARHRLYVYERV